MKNPPKIVVVIPTKNEEATICRVMTDVANELIRLNIHDHQFVITDDSHDLTRTKANQKNTLVISGGGSGLGLAMYKGLKAALAFNPDIIISLDSDGQVNCLEISQFLSPILNKEADLVIGSRFKNGEYIKYSYPFMNRIGTVLLAKMISYIIGIQITDSHGGIRAMIPSVAFELQMIGRHSYVQETIIDAHEKGFRILEIPSIWHKRRSGESKVVSSKRSYIYNMLPVLFLRGRFHIRWMMPLGISIGLISIFIFLITFYQTGLILFLIGFQLIFSSIILEFLSEMKKTQCK